MSKIDETSSTNDFADIATKKKSFLPICVVILVAIVIGIGGFYYYFSTPKKIVTTVINDAYANYDKMINEGMDFNLGKDSFKLKGNLVIDTNVPGFEKLKNDKLNFTLGSDFKNEKLETDASLVEGKTTILDAMIYVINNKTYLSLGDDYKNLIDLGENEGFAEAFDIKDVDFNKDDINYIVEAYKDILINAIDYSEIEKSSDKIEIDGKDTKVTKLTYKLNSKNLEKLSKNVIDGTLNNDKLLSTIAKLSEIDKKELKEELKDSKKDIKVDEDAKLTLNIYTKGFTNKFAGLDLKADEFEMNVVKNEDATNIKMEVEGFKVELNVKEYSTEKADIDFVVTAAGQKIKGSLVATSKNKDKDTNEGSFKFNVKYEDYKFNIDMNYTLEKNAKVADVDTKTAVTSEKAAKDLEKVETKIMTRIQKSNIYEIIEGLSSLYSPTATYNYNY